MIHSRTGKYKGQFDDGWDVYREQVFARQKELGVIPHDAELSRHDPDVKPWDECTPDERKLYARMMEVYAGFLEHTDFQIGRLLDFLKRIDAFDNTLIIALSDNGASSEGGPNGMININMWHNNLASSVEENLAVLDELGGPKHFNHYAWGWTFAGNTPFRRWKRETYRGGISDPLIVHWPASRRTAKFAANMSTPSTLCRRCSTVWIWIRRRRFEASPSLAWKG